MTLAKRYTSNSHCVFNLGYHIVFCPKYRRKVLVNGVDERLKILLQQKADELGITLENMEVMPDHVHLFIRSKPTYAIHFVINQLKGYSSVCLRKEFPWLRSRPLKSPFLRDIVQVQYLAYFLKHAQKSFHSSFEVICCCREKYVHSISYHTLIKVAAQTIIRL